MDKVWFKLRQTDYPPPTEESMGTMEETGPICLGHFIADIEHIDFALNQGCIEEFPPSMRVYQTKTIHFKWDENTEASGGGSFGMGAPAPGGMAIKGSLKQVFRRSVHSYEEYDRLDTYIVQPNKAYIAECLEIDELASHIAGKRSWSAFMITGLKVARKGFKTLHQARGTKNELGSEMDIPSIVTVETKFDSNRDVSLRKESAYASDFVWAVRLAKISKGLLMRNWLLQPYTQRATFGTEEGKVDVVGSVAAEGLDAFTVVEDDDLEEVFVLELLPRSTS